MNEKQKEKAYQGCGLALVWLVLLLVGWLICSCKSVEYVPVVQTNTEHHWHTDSVFQVDSVVNEKETTIMQLDSAAMAEYGIQLKAAEKAWLVRSKELERQIAQLKQMTASKDTVRDSIPVPYEVKVRVPAKVSKMERAFMWLGILSLMALTLLVGRWLSKHV